MKTLRLLWLDILWRRIVMLLGFVDTAIIHAGVSCTIHIKLGMVPAALEQRLHTVCELSEALDGAARPDCYQDMKKAPLRGPKLSSQGAARPVFLALAGVRGLAP